MILINGSDNDDRIGAVGNEMVSEHVYLFALSWHGMRLGVF